MGRSLFSRGRQLPFLGGARLYLLAHRCEKENNNNLEKRQKK